MRSRALKPGRHSDGGGLYLNVKPAGSKSWLFMWVAAGKRREMGLGAYPEVGLAKARKLAAEHREATAAGRDPIAERQTVPDAQLAVGMTRSKRWHGKGRFLAPSSRRMSLWTASSMMRMRIGSGSMRPMSALG